MAQANSSTDESSGMPALLNTLASAIMAPFGFSLAIGLPSALLYSLQLGLILARPKIFKSSFFKLFAAKAVSNLIGFIGAFLGQRFGRLGWFLQLYLQMPRLLLCFFFFLIVHSFHMDNLSTAILLLNRLTAILFPTKYEKFWKKILPFAMATIFLLPLTVTWHIFTLDEFVRIQMDNSTYTLDTLSRQDPSPEISSCSAILFMVICLLLNVATLLAYRHNVAMLKAQSQESQNMETKFTIYTLITFLAQLLYAVYMILLYLSVTSQLTSSPETGQLLFLIIFNQIPWVNDLSTIAVPSWLLLWASSVMREELMKLTVNKLPYFKARNGQDQKGQWKDPTIELSRNLAPADQQKQI